MNQRLDIEGTALAPRRELSPYIKKLKTILSDLVEEQSEGHVEYLNGAEGEALYKDNDVAVQMLTLKTGERFPEHQHLIEKEWIILIKGSGTVWVDNQPKRLIPRDYLVIEPGQNHYGLANEDTWLLCVAIPADEGYPDVSN